MGTVHYLDQSEGQFSINSEGRDFPKAFLLQVPVRERVETFMVPNPTEDFRDKVIQNIGQTMNNLQFTLLEEEVKKIMGDMDTSWVSGGPELPFEWLYTIYSKSSIPNKKQLMEQFIHGYRKLIEDTIKNYREQLPSDILMDDRIRHALNDFENILENMKSTKKSVNMWTDPYKYFSENHHILR